jgi:hypothetical protein
MDFIRGMWNSTSITIEGLWSVAGLAAFALLLFILTARARRGRPFAMRPLAAVERIRAALGRAMETGEEMHVALGTGRLNDLSAADTLAGLYLVSHLARRGAVAEVPVRVRVADPTALAGVLAVLQAGAVSAGYPEAFEPDQAEFVAPTPLAYGVGLAEGLQEEPIAANAMVGRFGPEVLLPGQAGIERGLVQIGGTSAPSMQPLFLGSTDVPLVGEEIYALGAALGRPEHTGSLATQDVFRALLAFGIVIVAVLGLLGI